MQKRESPGERERERERERSRERKSKRERERERETEEEKKEQGRERARERKEIPESRPRKIIVLCSVHSAYKCVMNSSNSKEKFVAIFRATAVKHVLCIPHLLILKCQFQEAVEFEKVC
jgi:ATP-dependent 26S proteasome regulatory subunit